MNIYYKKWLYSLIYLLNRDHYNIETILIYKIDYLVVKAKYIERDRKTRIIEKFL